MSAEPRRYPSELPAWQRKHPNGHQCYQSGSQAFWAIPCPCPCAGCRPDLTDDELAALSRELEPMANALYLAAMMFLATEGLGS